MSVREFAGTKPSRAVSLSRKFGYEAVGERMKQSGKNTVLVKKMTTALH